MRTRTARARRGPTTPVLALVMALALGACREPGAEPVASSGQAAPDTVPGRPVVSDAAITPQTSRPLGMFETEAAAVTAARAAGLAPGVYGLAMAAGVPLAITADGTVYARERWTGEVAPSGVAQRPPQQD